MLQKSKVQGELIHMQLETKKFKKKEKTFKHPNIGKSSMRAQGILRATNPQVTRLYYFWHSQDYLEGVVSVFVIWTSKTYFPSSTFYCSMCAQMIRSSKTTRLFKVKHSCSHNEWILKTSCGIF